MYAEKLKELGVTLPAAPGKGGLYAPTKTFGENKLMYVSGCGCNIPGEESFGKLGQEYTTEQGQKWARNAMMNVLAVFGDEIGLPTRSAVGMNVLPGNIAVEIEALVSYK